MAQDTMKQHGVFSWNELMTTDVEGAKAFYGELLGWEFQEMHTGEMNYIMIKGADRDIGGMMATPPEAAGMPSAWGAYVTVDDVDARTAQAEQLGGKVSLQPQDIPDVGRFSVIQDPQGATLMLITYSNPECK